MSERWSLLMPGYVEVEQATDHLLILRVVFFRFFLEELNRGFGQADSDFCLRLIENQLMGRREEVINNLHIPQWFIRVFYFLFHRSSLHFASTRPL